MRDVLTALRTLRKQPRFTIAAALTLALGIGATTAIFSVVNGVLFKPLPYPDDDKLVNVYSNAPGLGYNQFPVSADIYYFYKANSKSFASMGMFVRGQSNLTGQGDPVQITVQGTTASYFPTLQVAPAMGQMYGESDDKPGAPRVAVISDRFWQRQFAGRADVVGQTMRLDDETTTILGVMPASLDQPNSTDVWRPARLDPANPPVGAFRWAVVARLAPGETAEHAQAELVPLVKRIVEESAARSNDYRAFLTNGQYSPLVKSMKEAIVGDVRRPLWVLLGTVGFVLLIACVNVASLCLIRAEARQREIGIRAALGARRGMLVRQLLTEAVVLAALGGVLGVIAASAAVPALLSLAPTTLPRVSAVTLDWRVMLFAAGASLISALIFGLVPALRYTRTGAMTSSALRQGGRGSTDGLHRQRGRQALVVLQTAMALVLLIGSGLLAKSFMHMVRADLGFSPADVVTFRISLPAAAPYADAPAVTRFEQQLLERLRQIPGVDAAGAASVLPLVNAASGTAHVIDGQPVPSGQLPPMIHYKVAMPGYFEAMGIRTQLGRGFETSDLTTTTPPTPQLSIVVNRAMADKFWPGQNPVGKRLRTSGNADTWFSVVGVVASERQNGIREVAPGLIYYLPGAGVDSARTMNYVVRGRNIAERTTELRAAVWAIDPKLPLAVMQSMDELVSTSMLQFSFTALTLAVAAGVALLLGAIGLYGVLSYAVSLRTREIGVRLALGAEPRRVMRSVVLQGTTLAGIGLIVGLAGAAALTRVLEGILFDTKPLDLATFATTAGVMAVVALIASYLPARRAASVSPLESLRAE